MSKLKQTYCQCLFYSVNALARNITRLAEQEFAITGLNPSYAFVVMTVNREPGISIGDMAKVMQLRPSTLTRFIEKLEKEDFLERRTEGRFTYVFPKAKAEQIISTCETAWYNLYNRFNTLLGKEEAAELVGKITAANSKFE